MEQTYLANTIKFLLANLDVPYLDKTIKVLLSNFDHKHAKQEEKFKEYANSIIANQDAKVEKTNRNKAKDLATPDQIFFSQIG